MKMLMSYLQLLALLVAGNLCLGSTVLAWEVITHEELTEEAIKIKKDDLNTYLINNLGLEGGLGEVVGGEETKKTAREWIIEGSNKEDGEILNPISLSRPVNHFHDPTANVGLGGESAINWALAPIGSQSPGGPWSWNDAREYYFKALISSSKTERDENWGKTFRALGQVMHLIQDGANPAHVRADAHLDLSFLFGTLGRIDVDGLHDYMAVKSVSSYVGGGTVRPDSILLESTGATRPEPFSNLFDHNTYTGLNPEGTSGLDVGVTEYAHANFFSDDTIPFQVLGTPSHNFPSLAELIPATGPFPSGKAYLTLLRLGSSADPSARVAKYTGNQALAKFSLSNLSLGLIGRLKLDNAVYDAQAQNLIPRAVGYSAAVLDYFFRPQYTLEPNRHVFQVIGTVGFSGACEHIFSIGSNEGHLSIEFTIPSDLNLMEPLLYIISCQMMRHDCWPSKGLMRHQGKRLP